MFFDLPTNCSQHRFFVEKMIRIYDTLPISRRAIGHPKEHVTSSWTTDSKLKVVNRISFVRLCLKIYYFLSVSRYTEKIFTSWNVKWNLIIWYTGLKRNNLQWLRSTMSIFASKNCHHIYTQVCVFHNSWAAAMYQNQRAIRVCCSTICVP